MLSKESEVENLLGIKKPTNIWSSHSGLDLKAIMLRIFG